QIDQNKFMPGERGQWDGVRPGGCTVVWAATRDTRLAGVAVAPGAELPGEAVAGIDEGGVGVVGGALAAIVAQIEEFVGPEGFGTEDELEAVVARHGRGAHFAADEIGPGMTFGERLARGEGQIAAAREVAAGWRRDGEGVADRGKEIGEAHQLGAAGLRRETPGPTQNEGSADRFVKEIGGVGGVAGAPQAVAAEELAGDAGEDDQGSFEQPAPKERVLEGADLFVQGGDGGGGAADGAERIGEHLLALEGGGGGGLDAECLEARVFVKIRVFGRQGVVGGSRGGVGDDQEERSGGRLPVEECAGVAGENGGRGTGFGAGLAVEEQGRAGGDGGGRQSGGFGEAVAGALVAAEVPTADESATVAG